MRPKTNAIDENLAKVVLSWEAWAEKRQVIPPWPSVAEARATVEAAALRLSSGGAVSLPWAKLSSPKSSEN